MIREILADFLKLADGLDETVASRRVVSKIDPVSDGIEYAVRRLRAHVARVDEETKRLTVAEFAKLHQTAPSTVRLWILRGELPAEKTPQGDYAIPRSARRTKRLRNRGGRPSVEAEN